MTVGNFGNRLVWAHGYVRSPNVYFYCAKCGVCGDLVRKAGVGHKRALVVGYLMHPYVAFHVFAN